MAKLKEHNFWVVNFLKIDNRFQFVTMKEKAYGHENFVNKSG